MTHHTQTKQSTQNYTSNKGHKMNTMQIQNKYNANISLQQKQLQLHYIN
jgi:hypothetical protein